MELAPSSLKELDDANSLRHKLKNDNLETVIYFDPLWPLRHTHKIWK